MLHYNNKGAKPCEGDKYLIDKLDREIAQNVTERDALLLRAKIIFGKTSSMTICQTHRNLFTKDFLRYVAKKTCSHPDHETETSKKSKNLKRISFEIALDSIRLCNQLLPYGAPICVRHECQALADIAKEEEPISQELCIIGQIPSSQSSIWSEDNPRPNDDMDYEEEKPSSDPPDVAALKDFLAESGQKAELPHVLEKDFDLCDDSTKRKFMRFYAAASLDML